MGYKIFDFICTACAGDFEELVNDPSEAVECPECHAPALRTMPAPSIGIGTDPQKHSEALKKRSAEHTQREQQRGNLYGPKDAAAGKAPPKRKR